ncbi:MAG: hypothetical protein V3V61_06430, partial [Gammaproteobacteria bacterium]
GWDTSMHRTHLSAYGLGSPFPEDAKLCAALSAFWPAAAPDTTRTFLINPPNDENISMARIVAPMMDKEIGSVAGSTPWDGVQGPQVDYEQRKVTIANIFFADYVFNSVNNKFTLASTSEVSIRQYVQRVKAMQVLRNLIDQDQRLTLGQAGVALLSFKENWDAQAPTATTYDIEIGRLNNIRKTNTHAYYEADIDNAFKIHMGQDGSGVTVDRIL